jgi:hypothetical protein
MSSNMMPPRLVPCSCSDAKKTHIAHCDVALNRDQKTCIASCISLSLH